MSPRVAAARLARLLDDAAGALAAGAGALDGEETLLRADPPAALAGRAGDRLRSHLGAAPLAALAGNQRRHPDAGLLALEGVLQADLEIVAQVVAAALRLALPAAHELAEHLVENVGKARAEAEIARPRPAAALFEGGVAEAVIGSTLLLVL
jgi:hypothetical protein